MLLTLVLTLIPTIMQPLQSVEAKALGEDALAQVEGVHVAVEVARLKLATAVIQDYMLNVVAFL